MILQERLAFGPDELDAAQALYQRLGFVILRGLYAPSFLDAMARELAHAQRQLIAGELDPEFGSDLLDEPGARIDGKPHRHYVIYCTRVSPSADEAANHPAIVAMAEAVFGRAPWLNDYAKFGVVYQDARPDPGSHYARIGWHSDYQSDEGSESWPGFAFTIHLDGTSPANGFLRVVPGSHQRDADKDELGSKQFETLPGEVPVFAERGDVILHDYKLWHSAARGSADGLPGRRRHIRGGWFTGTRFAADHGIGEFYKNAAR